MSEYDCWLDFLNKFISRERCIEGLEPYFKNQQELKASELQTFLKMFSEDSPHGVLSEAKIVKERGIPLGTVKNHRTAIYLKLGLTQTDEDDRAIDPRQKKGGDLWCKLWAGYQKLREDSQVQKKTIFGRPTEVPRWKGRDVLLNDLYNDIENGRKVTVLYGQCGIGKTSLATKLLEKCGLNIADNSISESCIYYNILYFKAKDSHNFYALAEKFLEAFGMKNAGVNLEDKTCVQLGIVDLIPSQQIIEIIIDKLTQDNWLVAIDDLDSLMGQGSRCMSSDIGNLLNQIVHENHISQIIITSQKLPLDLEDSKTRSLDIDFVRAEKIEALSEVASIQLLKELGMQDTEEDLAWIAGEVNGNPKILELLAKYADRPGQLRNEKGLVTKNVKPIVEAQLQKQGEPAQNLLKRMCILRIGMNASELNILRSFNHNGEETKCSKEFGNETGALLENLKNCGLVDEIYDRSAYKNLYLLHSSIAEALQDIFGQDLTYLWQCAASLYDSFDLPKDFRSLGDLRFIREKIHFWWLLERYEDASETFIELLLPSLRQWGYWGLQQEWCEKALIYTKGASNRTCRQALACIYRDTGRWDEAEDYFQLLLADAEKERSSIEIATLTVMLGGIAGRRGHWNKAIKLFEKSLKLYTKLKDLAGIASCWVRIGNINRNRGNWDEAEELFQKSLDLRTKLGNLAGMASCWCLLGDIARNRGDWDKAIELYEQSHKLHIENEVNNPSGLASCLIRMGTIARKRGDWEESQAFFQDALKRRTKLGDISGRAMCLGFLGDIASCLNKWEEAKELLQQFLDIATKLGNRSGMAIAWRFQGKHELRQGNFEDAETLLKKALTAMDDLQMVDSIAETSWDLMRLYQAKCDKSQAQKYHSISLDLFTKLGAKKDLEKVESEWSSFTQN
jgi:tetratricopeptide (TPR) repeat protein/Cdc6-like AAA superfamily ATPase